MFKGNAYASHQHLVTHPRKQVSRLFEQTEGRFAVGWEINDTAHTTEARRGECVLRL
jgi:hypothetical protein